MWLDSGNERNAIRSYMDGPFEDLATLDYFWPCKPEADHGQSVHSFLAQLFRLFGAMRPRGAAREALEAFGRADRLPGLS